MTHPRHATRHARATVGQTVGQAVGRAAWGACGALLLGTLLATPGTAAGDDPKPDPKPIRVFEMRTYTAHPGKLEALHSRFRDHTNRLFVKHGMELVGYWTPTDGERAADTLVYILAYPSREAREKSWEGFRNDPEWQRAFEESHKDGPLVKQVESVFLAPTDYSPIK